MLFISSISFIGTLIATSAGVMVGFLWYSDYLFAKQWMRLSKIAPDSLDKNNMILSAVAGSGVTLLQTIGIVVLYHYFGSLEKTLWALGFIIAFTAVNEMGSLVWERTPTQLYLINMGHRAVSWVTILLVYASIHQLFI